MSPERTAVAAPPVEPTQRQEVQRVPEHLATPPQSDWEELPLSIPYVRLPEDQSQLMQQALALRESRLLVKNTREVPRMVPLLKRRETYDTPNPIPVVASGRRGEATYLAELFRQGQGEVISNPDQETDYQDEAPKNELQRLFELKSNETIIAEVTIFDNRLPHAERCVTQSIHTEDQLFQLMEVAAALDPNLSVGEENANQSDDESGEDTDRVSAEDNWDVRRIPVSVETLSHFVVQQANPDHTLSAPHVAVSPGEIIMIQTENDGSVGSMIRLEKRTLDPALEVEFHNPQVDPRTASPAALEQALVIAVSREAGLRDERLPVVRDRVANLDALLASSDVREILESLRSDWGDLFAPFISAIEKELDTLTTKEAKRQTIDQSGLAMRLVRNAMNRHLGTTEVLAQAKDTLIDRVHTALKGIRPVLERHALECIRPEILSKEKTRRYAVELLELCGLNGVVPLSGKDVLDPLYKLFTTKGDWSTAPELKSQESLQIRLESLLGVMQEFLLNATERQGSPRLPGLDLAAQYPGLTPDQIESLVRYLGQAAAPSRPQNFDAVAQPAQSRERLSYAQFEGDLLVLKNLLSTLSTATASIRQTIQVNGERGQRTAQKEVYKAKLKDMKETIERFFSTWNYLLEMPPLDSALTDAYENCMDPDLEGSFFIEQVSVAIRLVESKLFSRRRAAEEFQKDLALKVKGTPLAETVMGDNALVTTNKTSATVRIIDSLVGAEQTAGYSQHLEEKAEKALISAVLSNQSPLK